MTTREIFRQNLKYYRKQKCLTQEALSEKIGLKPKYITNLEAQKKFPSPETIDAIAKVLEIKPALLFEDEGCPVNAVLFDKAAFIEKLVEGLSFEIRKDIVKYLDKNI